MTIDDQMNKLFKCAKIEALRRRFLFSTNKTDGI
jgi:hypothetical protein